MRYNWENAASLMKCRRLESLTQSRLRKRLIGIGRRDYEDRRKLRATAFRYPELKDILRQIGREREAGTEEKDITELVDIPILLRHSSSKQEIDGVTVGNNLPNLLPSEYALMDEPVFFKKYVDRQLQQFRSKPPTVFKQKTEKIRRPEPRLESGPIILAIDTSLSMAGRPLDISHALLTQIIYLARKQRRKCFLINFSVRARYMEISRPGQYAKVEEFFSKRLTGGTDGEEMLKASFKALQKDSFFHGRHTDHQRLHLPDTQESHRCEDTGRETARHPFLRSAHRLRQLRPGGIRQDSGQILEDIRMTFKDLPFLLFRQHGLQPSRHTAMAARTD